MVLLLVRLMSLLHGTKALRVGFYNNICPGTETIVRQVVENRFSRDQSITPALLRLFFHDCFVTVLAQTCCDFKVFLIFHIC